MPRAVVSRLACAWLACYVSVTLASLGAGWAGGVRARPDGCPCGHGPAAACPMHAAPGGRARCVLQSTSHHDGAPCPSSFVPPALARPAGVLPSPRVVLSQAALDLIVPVGPSSPPESPPPRA